jgi:hypothetical protein
LAGGAIMPSAFCPENLAKVHCHAFQVRCEELGTSAHLSRMRVNV